MDNADKKRIEIPADAIIAALTETVNKLTQENIRLQAAIAVLLSEKQGE